MNRIDYRGLRKCFLFIAEYGALWYQSGKWKVLNGAYDLLYSVMYENVTIAEIMADGTIEIQDKSFDKSKIERLYAFTF